MKHVIRFILCSVLLCSCIPSGKYKYMTHLSDEELEWITNRYVGEVMYFQSQDGTMDSITITNIRIHNSTDSVCRNYHTTGSGVYNANAGVDFSIRDSKGDDCFYIHKEYGDDQLRFGEEMLARWTPGSHPADTCMQFCGIVMDDIVFFEEKYMHTFLNMEQPPVPVSSLAWSKQYGLVQYSFQDGTVFNRIEIEK